MKIRPVEPEMFHVCGRVGGQTNRHDEANIGRLNSLLGRHTENPKWLEVADILCRATCGESAKGISYSATTPSRSTLN
jgi:hypothetical protein